MAEVAGAAKTGAGLRLLVAPFVATARSGVSTTDRLYVTAAEAAVLAEVGFFLGGLFREDFARRASEGRLDAEGRAVSRRERKRALTVSTSSRWAGAITRKTEDQYNFGMRALYDHRRSLRQAIETIESRLTVEPGQTIATTGGKRVRGYRNAAERFAKTRRLNSLRHRLAQVESRVATARPSVVHGGRRLLRTRNNLPQAGLTEERWRAEWDAARWFLTADGESGKKYGNETIRVTPDGMVTIKIPTALTGKYGSHLTLGRPLNLRTHRAAEWLSRLEANRAVGYSITYDPGRDRWYLKVAWTYPWSSSPPWRCCGASPRWRLM